MLNVIFTIVINMKIIKRNSINCDLNKFDCLAKKTSFIEIIEWTNGEGWDITIDNKNFSLTFGQLEAINYLTKHLDINS